MKFKILILAIIIAFAGLSCKKTTNVDVTLTNSGKLTYKLLDDAGKGLPNVKVSLYDNLDGYNITAALLDIQTTDQNGSVDFGELNASTYLVVPDSPMVNNIKYTFKEYLQVVGGRTKQKETKVSDYSGMINIHAFDASNTNLPLKNIGVLLVPYWLYPYVNNLTKIISLAEFKGTTNESGNVSFKVPSTKQYMIVLYNTTTSILLNYNGAYSVEKGGVTNPYLYGYYNY